jgi:hypothetical protein
VHRKRRSHSWFIAVVVVVAFASTLSGTGIEAAFASARDRAAPLGVVHRRQAAPRDAKTPEWITAVATSVAALAAILALYGAWRTLNDNRDLDRRRVTHEAVGRLEAPELIGSKAVMSAFLRGGLRPPSISRLAWSIMGADARLAAAPQTWKHLSESSALKDRRTVLQIAAYPNMLEGLAGMYNRGLLDERIVKTRVEIEARNFWEQASWWIDAIQSPEGGKKIFDEIEAMLKHLRTVEHPSPYEE